MRNTDPLITSLIIIFILGVWFYAYQTFRPPAAEEHTEPNVEETLNEGPVVETNNNITVESPAPQSVIGDPVQITGEAKGTWYFEGSFPVRIKDAEGAVLAEVPATAQGEWMTEEFVPFTLEISFVPPSSDTGTIEFVKANPSGMEEQDDSFELPILFREAAAVEPKEEGSH